ncbi:MAG: hypothetical protein ABJG47_19230 [Ekhidna sp.]
MKKIVLAVLASFSIIGYASSQEISSIDLSFNKLDKEDALIISTAVRFDFNNHGWSIGPAFLYSFGDQIEEREALKLTGFALSYENFLHGKTAKWNMFHSFDFVAQRIKDVQDSQIFDTNSNSFVPNKIEQIDKNILLGASAGVLWNLNEKLSISQTIGIGANVIFRNTTSDFDQFDDLFLNQQWSLKTGIRYNLGN